MKKKTYLYALLTATALNLFPLLLFAGNDKGKTTNTKVQDNQNNSVKNYANEQPKNNDHDGNGQGTGRGSGNIPIPADPNNKHGMINNGGNYNNGIKAQSAQVPFDGGLTIILAAGLGVGIKRASDRRKNSAPIIK